MGGDPLAGLRLLARFRLSAAIALGTLVYGMLGDALLEGWGPLDAFYMSVITLTTVGFREIHPLDGGGQLFTVSLIFLGLVALLSAVSTGTQLLASGEIGQTLRRQRMHRRLAALTDHFLICGFGRVGKAAAQEFEQAGVACAVLDSDPGVIGSLEDDGVPHLVAEATDEKALRDAGVLSVPADSSARSTPMRSTSTSPSPPGRSTRA